MTESDVSLCVFWIGIVFEIIVILKNEFFCHSDTFQMVLLGRFSLLGVDIQTMDVSCKHARFDHIC